jgi:chromosomal replication initiation ATPase DnaA
MADDILQEALALPPNRRANLIAEIRNSIEQERIQRYETVKSIVESVVCHKITDSRKRMNVRCRMFICYIMRKDGYTLEEIGKLMKKNHVTVLYSIRRMEDMLSLPRLYKEEIEQLKQIEELVYETEIQETDAGCGDADEGASE